MKKPVVIWGKILVAALGLSFSSSMGGNDGPAANLNGEKDKARAIFERVMKGPARQAFGYIAAEAELARTK